MYSAESLKELGDLLERKSPGAFLLSDEPYKKLIYDGKTFASILRAYPRSIVVSSHSKDLAIAGERIGYVAASPRIEEISHLMAAVTFTNRTLGFVNSPAIMQRAVRHLQHVTVDVAAYQKKRNIFYEALTQMGYAMAKPEGAFYLFPKSPLEDDVAFVRLLQKKNILTVPGSGFGTPGHFRIAYCVKTETILRSLDGFREAARDTGLSLASG
jgi:aspartate aminotransferase